MGAVRKSEEFRSELVEPCRSDREENAARFDACRAGAHADDLVALGLYGDAVDAAGLEVLDEAGSGALVLDQDRLRFPALLFGNDTLLQCWIFQSLAHKSVRRESVSRLQAEHRPHRRLFVKLG